MCTMQELLYKYMYILSEILNQLSALWCKIYIHLGISFDVSMYTFI